MTITHVRHVGRIGVRTVEQDGDEFYVHLVNRRSDVRYQVSREKARVWYRHFKSTKGGFHG